jgi:uncharacterized membrane protein YbhN (UPF0104 family)
VSKYLRIAISALLLAAIGWRTNWSDVADKFVHLRVDLWLAAVGLLVIAQIASARRWQLFAKELRFDRSLGQYSAYYFVGMYFNLSLPTSVGGDVVRVFYLNGESGRKWAALASVFLERLNGLLVLIAVACVGVLFAPMSLPAWIPLSVWGVAGAAVLGLASLPLLKRWHLLPAQRRQQLDTLVFLLHVPRVTIGATWMSVVVQVIGVLTLWCVGLSLGLEIPLTYYCILGPMVSLLTLLPISFNGMGLRELGMVVFLAPLGISEGTATTLGVLWFAATAAVSLMGGLVYLFGAYPKAQDPANLSSEETNEDGPVDRDSGQGREGQLETAA